MKHRIGKACLLTLSLVFAIGSPKASIQPSDPAGKPATGSKVANAGKNSKAKVVPKKAVDINSAGKAELKTLAGIDDARADKIIAGRPYLSKAFLVTRNIIPEGVYQSIKGQIIAIQK